MKLLKLLIVTYLLLLSSSVIAHTGLQSSSPSNGAALKQVPEVVDLNFKGPVKLLNVEIKGSDGNLIDLPPMPAGDPKKNFSLSLPDLPISAYMVNWVAAGADGHKIKGKFAFKYLGANGVDSETTMTDEAFSVSSISVWALGTLLNKLLLYIALAMTVGGLTAMFTQSRHKDHQIPFMHYLLLGCFLGIVAASLGFFLQVGSFAEAGIAGMWNHDYLPILWDSGAGQSYRLQLIGWLIVAVLASSLWFKSHFHPIFSLLAFIGVFIIATSFTLTGHTAEAPLWVRIALILHVVCAMWWIGSLYLLRYACKVLPITNLQTVMIEFGQQAMVLVGLLIALAIGVAYHLEGSFSNLLFTGHGNILLLKLASVAAILFIAAKHKWHLVPDLTSAQAAQALKRSITIEMIIGFVILLITAALSSLTGPAYG